jgi:teichuronic acid biosynthesis glycosyltransferase TuaG
MKLLEERVSIVTPAYKAERFIADTLASVVSQTYPHWEMLVVDVASPDSTGIIVERVAARDRRIRVLRMTENGGPARARNAALAEATGRYIAFLDADDLWLPCKLERQLDFHLHTGALLSFTGYRRTDDSGQRVGRFIGVPDRITYRQLLRNTAIPTSTVIIDRVKSGSFFMKEVYLDDFASWLELLRHGNVARGLQEDLMRYRVSTASHSSSKIKSAREVWNIYRNVEAINPIEAAWCFLNYSARACLKQVRF